MLINFGQSMVDTRSLPKLRKFCRIGATILMIGMIGIAFLLSIVALVFLLLLVIPEAFVEQFDVDAALIDSGIMAVTLISCFIGCHLVRQMMKSISSEDSTPFTDENIHRMKMISVLALMTFAMIIAVESVMWLILEPAAYLWDIPLTTLLISALTYVFSLLFEYGTALQTESDDFL